MNDPYSMFPCDRMHQPSMSSSGGGSRGRSFKAAVVFRDGQNGFTLLEIMVSLVLICLVVVSLLQLSSANLRNLASSGDRIETVERANEKMREVLEGTISGDKTWQDTDDAGYTYEIAVSEAMQEKTENLSVKYFEVTVSVKNAKERGSKPVTLKTAKAVSGSDALKK